jgi:hypothetical protein
MMCTHCGDQINKYVKTRNNYMNKKFAQFENGVANLPILNMNEMKKKGRRTTAAPTSPTYRLSSEYTTILPALYDSSLTFYSLISYCDKHNCR